MVAIAILLAHYNDEPIFDWNGVTLNAIIAVFSAMSKAMLAFTLSECLGQAKWIWFSSQQRPLSDVDLIDAASRGPLGSFRILGQPGACSFISMGAIIVILSAAIDPFVQLTVGKGYTLKFENNSNVRISYAKRYSKGSFTGISGTIPVSGDPNYNSSKTETDADFEMKSAVFYGLSQPDSLISQQTQRSCSSGNCTWDTFTSLAVCSGCNDLTNKIEIEKVNPDEYPLVFSLDISNDVILEHSVTTKYRLPNGLSGDSSIQMTAYGTSNETESVSFTSHDTLIWSMTMMNFTVKEEPTASVSVSAIECGLWYCVNSYKSAVKDGNLTETIEFAPSKRKPGSWRPFVEPIHWRPEVDPPPITYNRSSYISRMDLQLGEGFNLSQAAIYSISDFMYATFATPIRKKGINAWVLHQFDYNTTIYKPTAMQVLYNSQDLEATFASLAKSMTNNIRRNSDNNTVAYGKEGKYMVLIRIRGWFLMLPVILIFGGAAFFTIVLHYTNKCKIAFWGTNALPIVALGGKMGPVFNDNDMRASKMEEYAKRQLVQFPTHEQRCNFSRADMTSRYGDYEIVSPLRTTVKQNSSNGAVSIVSDDA
ncbi:hypothetical protein MMC31_005334 [Peltigera leucophlebia]|nr:hypothetical protein [Peltigera leucophlebia]